MKIYFFLGIVIVVVSGLTHFPELTFFLLISPFPNHIFPSSVATELLFLCSAGHRETPPPILHDMDSLKFQETAFMGISRI